MPIAVLVSNGRVASDVGACADSVFALGRRQPTAPEIAHVGQRAMPWCRASVGPEHVTDAP